MASKAPPTNKVLSHTQFRLLIITVTDFSLMAYPHGYGQQPPPGGYPYGQPPPQAGGYGYGAPPPGPGYPGGYPQQRPGYPQGKNHYCFGFIS